MSRIASLLLCASFLAITGCGSGGKKIATGAKPNTAASTPNRRAGASGAGGPGRQIPRRTRAHSGGSAAGAPGQPRRASSKNDRNIRKPPGKQQKLPGSGSGPVVAVRAGAHGEIVIHGGPARRTYGPFQRKTPHYAVSYEQSKAAVVSIGVEPKAVSAAGSLALAVKSTKGKAVAPIFWGKFYIVVSGAASSYVLRLAPEKK